MTRTETVVRRFDASEWRTASSATTAQAVTSMMTEVVQPGTGTGAQIAGVSVAGKTGTAQVDGFGAPHAWFVAFAPAEAPTVAVAVIVENGGSFGDEATGGRVAAPIAAQVLRVALGASRPWAVRPPPAGNPAAATRCAGGLR